MCLVRILVGVIALPFFTWLGASFGGGLGALVGLLFAICMYAVTVSSHERQAFESKQLEILRRMERGGKPAPKPSTFDTVSEIVGGLVLALLAIAVAVGVALYFVAQRAP